MIIDASARPLRTLCTREYQKSIRESVHHLLEAQIDRLELPGWRVGQTEITNRNGSQFIFAGLRHEPRKIKSMEGLDRVWNEEAESTSEESLNLLLPTVRRPGSEVWFTLNPNEETDPVYKRFIKSPTPDTLLIFTTWKDNPWPSEVLRAEREHMYKTDPDLAVHVWEGKCRKNSHAQILAGKWHRESFEASEDWEGPYYGADWGFAEDPTTLIRCWVNGRRLLVDYEAYGLGVDIDVVPNLFREVPGAAEHTILADSARPETISYVRRHGFPLIMPVEKWSGSVEDGVTHLRSYEEIVIHPRCTHTIDEAKSYSYKVDRRTLQPTRVIEDKNNHLIDSLRYALTPFIRMNELDLAPITLD